MMSENTATPQTIESELDRTRSRLDGHLDELRGRLSPGQVVDELMVYFRGKEGAEFGRNLVDSMRGNPLPAAITGIGLTWLIAANPGAAKAARPSHANGADRLQIPQVPEGAYDPRWSGFGEGGGSAVSGRVRTAEQGVTRRPNETEAAYDMRLDEARGQALGLARHPEEHETSFSQRVRNALSSAQQAGMDKVHGLGDTAAQMASSAGVAAQSAGGAIGQGGSSLARMLGESPITLGALGLAAGALLGALLPQSDREETALGGIAGQARGIARDLGQQAVDGGGHVAQAVLDKGQASAEEHGLTGNRSPGELVDAAMSGSLAEDARQVAGDVLHSGDAAIRKETTGREIGGNA